MAANNYVRTFRNVVSGNPFLYFSIYPSMLCVYCVDDTLSLISYDAAVDFVGLKCRQRVYFPRRLMIIYEHEYYTVDNDFMNYTVSMAFVSHFMSGVLLKTDAIYACKELCSVSFDVKYKARTSVDALAKIAECIKINWMPWNMIYMHHNSFYLNVCIGSSLSP